MSWGLIAVCAVALGLFAALNRGGKKAVCPKGCHGCGKCMKKIEKRPEER